MILPNQQMEMALGLPIAISGFNDNAVRMCYPFKLYEIKLLYLYLGTIDNTDLYANFEDEMKTQSMAEMFIRCFQITENEEVDVLLHSIDKDNFAEIVSDIKTVNGINGDADNVNDIPSSGSDSSMSWEVAVNIIPLYSATPIDKVKEMTVPQFNKTMELIAKKINYEYKQNTISMVEDPSEYISESEHPLYCELENTSNDKKHITMADIQGLFDMQ